MIKLIVWWINGKTTTNLKKKLVEKNIKECDKKNLAAGAPLEAWLSVPDVPSTFFALAAVGFMKLQIFGHFVEQRTCCYHWLDNQKDGDERRVAKRKYKDSKDAHLEPPPFLWTLVALGLAAPPLVVLSRVRLKNVAIWPRPKINKISVSFWALLSQTASLPGQGCAPGRCTWSNSRGSFARSGNEKDKENLLRLNF